MKKDFYCWKCNKITEWETTNRRLLQIGSGRNYTSIDRYLNNFVLFSCTECKRIGWSKIKEAKT